LHNIFLHLPGIPQRATLLETLLKSIDPVLNPGTYVFGSVRDLRSLDPVSIVACIREQEGLSVVLREEDANRQGVAVLFRCAWITLNVNSALQAVGLTAAFSQALGDVGVSCNVVAGAFHDHIFVPKEEAEKAMNVLRSIQRKANAK